MVEELFLICSTQKTISSAGVLNEEMKYFILLINAVENSDLNEQISLLLTEKKDGF